MAKAQIILSVADNGTEFTAELAAFAASNAVNVASPVEDGPSTLEANDGPVKVEDSRFSTVYVLDSDGSIQAICSDKSMASESPDKGNRGAGSSDEG